MSIQKVRAKFTCLNTEDQRENGTAVSLGAVTYGSEENESFSKYTPSGQLTMQISEGVPASGFFKQGKEYYRGSQGRDSL